MMEENNGVKQQNSKKGVKKNEHACSVERVFEVLDSTAHLYSKLAGPTWTRTNQI